MRYQPFAILLSTLNPRFHGDAVCTARGCVCACARVHVREAEGQQMKCSWTNKLRVLNSVKSKDIYKDENICSIILFYFS